MASFSSLFAMSVILVGQAIAPQPIPVDVVQQLDQHFIGDFVYEGKYGEQAVNGVETWKWASGKCAVIVEGVLVVQSQRNAYTSLLGWDADEKCLVSTGYFENGDTATTRWSEFAPNGWKGRIVGVTEGQKYEAPAKIEFLPDSSLRYEDTTAGKPWITIGKRVSPSNIDEAHKAFKAYAELAIGGVWVANSNGLQFEDKYESILDGKYILLTSKGSGDFPAAISIGGVDPVSKKFTFWGFSALGEAWVGTSRLESSGVWLGESRGSGPNSGATQVTRLTRVDADTVRFEILEETVSGTAKPFPKVTTWRRQE